MTITTIKDFPKYGIVELYLIPYEMDKDLPLMVISAFPQLTALQSLKISHGREGIYT